MSLNDNVFGFLATVCVFFWNCVCFFVLWCHWCHVHKTTTLTFAYWTDGNGDISRPRRQRMIWRKCWKCWRKSFTEVKFKKTLNKSGGNIWKNLKLYGGRVLTSLVKKCRGKQFNEGVENSATTIENIQNPVRWISSTVQTWKLNF